MSVNLFLVQPDATPVYHCYYFIASPANRLTYLAHIRKAIVCTAHEKQFFPEYLDPYFPNLQTCIVHYSERYFATVYSIRNQKGKIFEL